ncbi:ead/Ea22-like family protein [Salmonella enterica]|nr:ead/Ea22-like family protein [Salmonella enterica]EDS6071581.1 ead/Ea22-like family protein [Salmonella enterica subsp. enterica serovar Pomona]EHE7865429.1 ead/Ea22-like family protein [Salmonella enterica subsp. enterica serovar Abony]EEJ8361073.1 ead/Ea22-like family protein [Salmonella enterica]ELD7008992.1 ead/Ea22-like family protein [Salmonella enterica]
MSVISNPLTDKQIALAAELATARVEYVRKHGAPLLNNEEEVTLIALRELQEKRKLLKAAEKRMAELEAENEYIRNRYKELDLLIGKNILVMQAAIIEWQSTGDAKNGLTWIYNTLLGPGELPDEAEKYAQAYFDRKCAPLDEEIIKLHQWFWERSEAERAAAPAPWQEVK